LPRFFYTAYPSHDKRITQDILCYLFYKTVDKCTFSVENTSILWINLWIFQSYKVDNVG